jgi:hypothetical protein
MLAKNDTYLTYPEDIGWVGMMLARCGGILEDMEESIDKSQFPAKTVPLIAKTFYFFIFAFAQRLFLIVLSLTTIALTLSPFHLRYKTVLSPFLRIGEKRDLQGIC